MAHRLAEVLAAVRRDEDDALVLEVDVLEGFLLEVKVIAHRVVQGIDDCVARDEDGLGRHILCEQIGLRRARRREVEVGDAACQAAVHLLGERRVLVVGAQARLDVADGRLMVIGSECAGECRRRVAVDEHDIRLLLRQDLVEAHHGARRDVKKCLAGRHDVEIMVRFDLEEIEYLIEHLAMLCRDGHDRQDGVRMLLELEHDWCHLDCLRARAEDRHDLDLLLFHCKTSSFQCWCAESFIWKIPSFLAPKSTTATTTQTIAMAIWLLTSVRATALRPKSALMTYISRTAWRCEKPRSSRR